MAAPRDLPDLAPVSRLQRGGFPERVSTSASIHPTGRLYPEAVQLRLGFRYEFPASASRSPSPADLVAAALDHAAAAEEQGFDTLWVVDGSGLPCAPLAAALAARTRRVRVGALWCAGADLHPLRLAEDAATLDEVSGGRLEVGLGEIDSEAEQRLDETLNLLQQSWGAGPVSLQGRTFAVAGLEVFPKPQQQPGPPVWIGTDSWALPVHHGCGLWTRTPGLAADFLLGWCRSGRDPGEARIALALDESAGRHPGGSQSGEILLEQAHGVLEQLAAAGEVQLLFPALGSRLDPDAARQLLAGLAEQCRTRLARANIETP